MCIRDSCCYARRCPQEQALQAQPTAQQCDGAGTRPPREVRPRPRCGPPWARGEGGRSRPQAPKDSPGNAGAPSHAERRVH
eukprot:8807953-Alexandrium_andersonii.AAC.1